MILPATTARGSGATDAVQVQKTESVSGNQQAERVQKVCQTLKEEEKEMTGLEMAILKGFATFTAKAIFDMV